MRGLARRLSFIAASAAAISAALYTGACAPEDTTDPAPTGGDPIDDVIYQPGATDEGLRALLAAEPEVRAAQAAILDTPADGASLPASPPPELTWHIRDPLGAAGGPRRRERARGEARRTALGELLGPAREARAHGAPMNGRGYLLIFTGPGGEALVRVFTTALAYTPHEATWAELHAAGGPITVEIINAVFEDNAIAAGGGPFAGEPITFSIAP